MAIGSGADSGRKLLIMGSGPGNLGDVSVATVEALRRCDLVLLRTKVHPGMRELMMELSETPVLSFDPFYENATDFESLYLKISDTIVELLGASDSGIERILAQLDLVGGSRGKLGSEISTIAYVTPGSPMVAEKSVELLQEHLGEETSILPAISFVDLAFARLRVDPFASSVTFLDSMEFCDHSDRYSKDLLISQVWSRELATSVLDIVGDRATPANVWYLHHLGQNDEQVLAMGISNVNLLEFDHLTSVFVKDFSASEASAFVSLSEIVLRLRSQCPWDKKQTHESLGKHLIEEAYEVIDAIEILNQEISKSQDALDSDGSQSSDEQFFADEFAGELGDLLVQVLFHSVIADEEGLFDLGFVLDTIREKLIRRHPHVFEDLEVTGVDEVLFNWEAIKRSEKSSSQPAQGVPSSLPGLLYAAKVIRKAQAFGYQPRSAGEVIRSIQAKIQGGEIEDSAALADLVFTICELAKVQGVDLESGLKQASRKFSAQHTGD